MIYRILFLVTPQFSVFIVRISAIYFCLVNCILLKSLETSLSSVPWKIVESLLHVISQSFVKEALLIPKCGRSHYPKNSEF